eukprot:955004_1
MYFDLFNISCSKWPVNNDLTQRFPKQINGHWRTTLHRTYFTFVQIYSNRMHVFDLCPHSMDDFSIHLTIECPMNKQPFSMPNLFPIRFYSPSIQLQIVVLSDVILGYIKTDTFHFSWRLALFAYC